MESLGEHQTMRRPGIPIRKRWGIAIAAILTAVVIAGAFAVASRETGSPLASPMWGPLNEANLHGPTSPDKPDPEFTGGPSLQPNMGTKAPTKATTATTAP